MKKDDSNYELWKKQISENNNLKSEKELFQEDIKIFYKLENRIKNEKN